MIGIMVPARRSASIVSAVAPLTAPAAYSTGDTHLTGSAGSRPRLAVQARKCRHKTHSPAGRSCRWPRSGTASHPVSGSHARSYALARCGFAGAS